MSSDVPHEPRASWYGRCPCGGSYVDSLVELQLTGPRNAVHRLTEVPRGICPECSAHVYKLAVLQRIEGVYKGLHPDREPDV